MVVPSDAASSADWIVLYLSDGTVIVSLLFAGLLPVLPYVLPPISTAFVTSADTAAVLMPSSMLTAKASSAALPNLKFLT